MRLNLLLSAILLLRVTNATEIPADTHLLLRTEHSISSATAKIGDGVHLRTVVPIVADGKIVIPTGSYAQGTVEYVRRGGRRHKQAELRIKLATVTLPSNEVFKISATTSSTEGEFVPGGEQVPGTKPFSRGTLGNPFLAVTLAGAIAGGQTGARVGVGALAAGYLIHTLAARGKEVEIRHGAAVDVVFDRPVRLD